jgi:hypothetical protein
MSNVVTAFGLATFAMSVQTFMATVGLAVFAYERAESRARRLDDARWLLASLVAAVTASAALEVQAADGFSGLGLVVLEALLACALVGTGEIILWVWSQPVSGLLRIGSLAQVSKSLP